MAEIGVESIMINCNPETVSTDYDTSDRLYFEPLTAEDVLEVLHVEGSRGDLAGVIVQFGGQTPLKLAPAWKPPAYSHPRHLGRLPRSRRGPRAVPGAAQPPHIAQPENGIARSTDEATAIAARVGYPVVIRPSHVLGGRGMEIVRDDAQLARYMAAAVLVTPDAPVLIDAYLSRATEVDIDALCDGDRRLRRRRAGAYRRGGRAFRRQRLLPAAVFAPTRDDR